MATLAGGRWARLAAGRWAGLAAGRWAGLAAGRWAGLAAGLCLALTSACVFGDDRGNDEAAGAEAAAPQALRVPDDVGDGCGDDAATDHTDLAADRQIARCGPGAPAPVPLAQPATLRVGVRARTEDLAPVLLALQEGEFTEEGLTVELVEIPDLGDLYAALGSGELDAVAGELDAPFFDLVNDGTGVRLVLGGAVARAANDPATPQPGLWVRSEHVGGAERWSDLENTRFAVEDGIADAVGTPATAVLRQDDLSLNEVRIDLVGGADAAALLRDGKVSAAWLSEPAWREVADDDRFRLVATLPASESISGVALSPRLVDRTRDRAIGLAFVRAVVRTINTYLADDYQRDDEVVAALADATGLDEDQLRATPPWLFDWELRQGTTERLQTTFVQVGAVLYEEEIPEREIVDRTLYRDAVAHDQA